MTIDNSILARAHRRIAAQVSVPESPGTFSSTDGTELCYAAALVAARAQEISSLDVESLIHDLVAQKSKQNVIDTGTKLGLDPCMLNDALIHNDSCSISDRKSIVLNCLETAMLQNLQAMAALVFSDSTEGVSDRSQM